MLENGIDQMLILMVFELEGFEAVEGNLLYFLAQMLFLLLLCRALILCILLFLAFCSFYFDFFFFIFFFL